MQVLLKTMMDYDKKKKDVLSNFDLAISELIKRYGSESQYSQEESNKLKESRDAKLTELRDAMLKTSMERFEGARARIKDFVTTPAPDEFLSTLELVKSGMELSEHEALSLWDKYRGNYFCRKALAPYLKDINQIDGVSLEHLNTELNDTEADTREWIERGFNSSWAYVKDNTGMTDDLGNAPYSYVTMLSDNSPLALLDNHISDFLGMGSGEQRNRDA